MDSSSTTGASMVARNSAAWAALAARGPNTPMNSGWMRDVAATAMTAPQTRAKARSRRGSGSQRSTRWSARSTTASGNSESRNPARKPALPVARTRNGTTTASPALRRPVRAFNEDDEQASAGTGAPRGRDGHGELLLWGPLPRLLPPRHPARHGTRLVAVLGVVRPHARVTTTTGPQMVRLPCGSVNRQFSSFNSVL